MIMQFHVAPRLRDTQIQLSGLKQALFLEQPPSAQPDQLGIGPDFPEHALPVSISRIARL